MENQDAERFAADMDFSMSRHYVDYYDDNDVAHPLFLFPSDETSKLVGVFDQDMTYYGVRNNFNKYIWHLDSQQTYQP